MDMDLYHIEIGFPAWFQRPTGKVRPQYGNHARFESQIDRYGRIQLPVEIDLAKFQVIEIGVEDGRLVKMLVRGQLDATRDICVVLTNTGFVKTVWVNLRTDKHRTLDRSKYLTPSRPQPVEWKPL